MDVVTIAALVFLIASWVVALINRTLPSSLDFAVWSIAVIAVFIRVVH